jgi:hypothetical protein
MTEGHTDADHSLRVVASDLANDGITLSGAKARTLFRGRDYLVAANWGSCHDDAGYCGE